MIKLNRTTEYGLIALRHMSKKHQQDRTAITSAREVADSYGLPFEITAKTLQRLKDTGIIHSAQGSKGGYTLQKSLYEVTLAEFLQMMEGPQAVVACASDAPSAKTAKAAQDCEYHHRCEIKGVMSQLNSRVMAFLSGIRLGEITEVQMCSGGEVTWGTVTSLSGTGSGTGGSSGGFAAAAAFPSSVSFEEP